jgi:quinoprotein glucose dehydrogenase
VLAILAVAVSGGGVWLIVLGGSPYYLMAGLAMALTAILLYRRSPAALAVHGALVAVTLAWAIWEVGFDWWQLGPRGGLIIVLGLWMLTPWVVRPLEARSARHSARRWSLLAPVLAAIAVAGYAMTTDPYDHAGTLPDEPIAAADLGGSVPPGEWHHYGRTPFGQRYSPLTEITTGNVGRLAVAWTYRTGDLRRPTDVNETTYEVTPLKIGNVLYLCTPHDLAIALDATTGAEKWRYDPKVPDNTDRQHQTCRGVSHYADPTATAGQKCAARIYLPTSDARLIALDAADGTVCPGFGREGVVDLEQGMPFHPAGYYYSTSPPAIADGKIIVGGAVNDNYSTREQSGVVRAYDIRTGALVWNWDSGNPTETEPLAPGRTYTANSPNSWSIASVDETLGLVYLPLGNKVPDQLGMNRSAAVETYSSSIVALELATGRVRWVRQTVHHDLWDMDVPAQPSLFDMTRADGSVVPALAGPTKQGDVYVLDRRTGEPLIPVTEVPAPGGTIPADAASPTQPLSGLSFMPRRLEGRDMWGVTMLDQLVCRIAFARLTYEGRYTPPSLNGSLIYPGNFGTFNWGGIAVDPVRQVMFAMPTYLAFTSRLVPRNRISPKGQDQKASEQGLNRNDGAPYGVFLSPFLSPLGIPCQAPPWGTVAGADLRTGKIAYQHRNGTVYDMTPLALKVGVPGIGGPMLTGGGVAFLSAAVDNYLRAYDELTGRQLWQARLPAGGQATPMTYTGDDGRQYVVIVAGGHGSTGTKAGDHVIAYALPKP